MLEFAIKDLNKGLNAMTAVALDEKFTSLKNLPLDKNIISSIGSIINLALQHCIDYNKLNIEYNQFRNEKLADQRFWRQYLNI